MEQNKSFLQKLISFLTYKEKREVNEFYIPEINEVSGNQTQEGNNSDKNMTNNGGRKERQNRKPTPIFDTQKEKTKREIPADDKNISTDVKSNINYLKQTFNFPDNKDLAIREFTVAGKYKAFIVYMDGMVDRITINNFIIRPLLHSENYKYMGDDCQLEYILENVLETNQAKKISAPGDAIYEILSGSTCLYVDGCDYYVSCETKGFEKRGVEKPVTEGVVRGAQEGFNENLKTNITLVRRNIKDTNLTAEYFKIGARNNIQCSILYIKGLANPALVNEVKRRIQGIKADLIMGDGMLEQFIEDSPFTLVPTILNTERPDRTASHIVEGRVAIIADGSPFALIVPVTIHSFFQTPEDSNLRWPFGTLLRFVRILAIFVATLLPGLYIALISFHREMIPTDLLISIISAKENVPFPTLVEVLLMEISFELIREAGIRIPGIIGNTIGIIGALILGQAAVQANIVSPILIIIVAVTGLGNFAIPNFSVAFAIRALRFVFIFSAALMGFYGIALAVLGVLAVLVHMKSFGIPYISITTPKTRESADLFIKKPVWKQEYRPDNINSIDVKRQPKYARKWAQEDAYSEKEDTISDRGDNND